MRATRLKTPDLTPQRMAELQDGTPTKLDFGVEGMTCAACSARIAKILSRKPGIVEAEVNFATGLGRIQLDGGAKVELEQVAEWLEGAGFALAGKSQGPRANPGLDPALEAPSARTSVSPANNVDASRHREKQEQQALLVRFGLAAAITGVVALGEHGGEPGAGMLLLAAIGVVGAGWPFWRGAARALRHRATTMDTLVAMGAGTAWVWSAYTILGGQSGDTWLHASTMLVSFILLGRALESRARGQALDAIRGLVDLQPSTASVLLPSGEEVVREIAMIQVGDQVLLRPGNRVPADGIVLSGGSAVDESTMTGEPVPVEKSAGDRVLSGTMNCSGQVPIEVTASAADSLLETTIRAVREAQSERAPIQDLADRIASWFVPGVIAFAALVASTWWGLLGADADFAVKTFVSIVVVACPCALGLATPIAILVGSGLGARRGILVRGGSALESAGSVTDVVFDKTGTLTFGRPRILRSQRPDLLPLWAAAEHGSDHPLARAVVTAARDSGANLEPAQSFDSVAGLGVRARIDDRPVLLGSRRFLEGERVRGIEAFDGIAQEALERGRSLLWAAVDGRCVDLLEAGDEPRPEAAEVVEALQGQGLRVHLLSGDSLEAARQLASRVGLTEDLAVGGLLPEEKLARIRGMQEEGCRVLMVGDGVNDAAALAAADLGMAMGSGSDVALDAAGMALTQSDLRGVARALRLGAATMRTVRQNLGWAFGYNLALLPIAAGFLQPAGMELEPAYAAAAMAASSLSVVINALRLRGLALD